MAQRPATTGLLAVNVCIWSVLLLVLLFLRSHLCNLPSLSCSWFVLFLLRCDSHPLLFFLFFCMFWFDAFSFVAVIPCRLHKPVDVLWGRPGSPVRSALGVCHLVPAGGRHCQRAFSLLALLPCPLEAWRGCQAVRRCRPAFRLA